MEMFNGFSGNVREGCKRHVPPFHERRDRRQDEQWVQVIRREENKLTNCNNFVFPAGDEFFFVIPTNKVEKGDIIIANGKPKCVISADKDTITAINYEDATIQNILPERHVFMGNTYFYGKIVSMFGNCVSGKKGMDKMFKYMMLSEMMKGSSNPGSGQMGAMLPFMMMGGDFSDMFDGMFDGGEEDKESEG